MVGAFSLKYEKKNKKTINVTTNMKKIYQIYNVTNNFVILNMNRTIKNRK